MNHEKQDGIGDWRQRVEHEAGEKYSSVGMLLGPGSRGCRNRYPVSSGKIAGPLQNHLAAWRHDWTTVV